MSDPSSPEPPDPATTSHLLSIPALLLPLSPSLAALHHARVKLHLLPAPGTGPALKDLEKRMKREAKGWCVHCGALRRARAAEAAQVTEADAAAAESGQSAGTSTEVRGTVGKRGRKRKVPPGGPRGRARSAGGGEVVENSSSIDGPSEAGPSRLASGPADTPLSSDSPFVIASNSRNTPTTTPMTKKRHIDCDTCGTPYSRPSPLKSKLARPALPPARVLRKRNSGTVDVPPSTGSTDVFGETTAVAISKPALHAANKVSSSPISTSSAATAPPMVSATPTAGTSTNMNQVAPSRLTSKPAETAKAASTPAVTSKAKPKQAPAFRYIPSTPSTLPTYPPPSSQPPVRPDSPPRSVSSIGPSEIATTGPSGAGTKTGTGAGTGVSVGGSAAAAATARKKSKKSGLAKLLAQSKEREQSGSAGNWGFG